MGWGDNSAHITAHVQCNNQNATLTRAATGGSLTALSSWANAATVQVMQNKGGLTHVGSGQLRNDNAFPIQVQILFSVSIKYDAATGSIQAGILKNGTFRFGTAPTAIGVANTHYNISYFDAVELNPGDTIDPALIATNGATTIAYYGFSVIGFTSTSE